MKKKKWIWGVIFCGATGVAGALVWALIRFYPLIQSLMQPEVMETFQKWLQSFGVLGAVVLVGVQFLQVLSGIIPALPIQIGAGLAYGAVWGLMICLCGVMLGSALVFAVVRRYGKPVVDRVLSQEKQGKLAFLQDGKRLEAIVFILYLIPAMPKDVFNYLAALTPLTMKRYLGIMITARIPTIFCSTFASGALMDGRYGQAVVVFGITATLGILCMVLSPRIMAFLERHAHH